MIKDIPKIVDRMLSAIKYEIDYLRVKGEDTGSLESRYKELESKRRDLNEWIIKNDVKPTKMYVAELLSFSKLVYDRYKKFKESELARPTVEEPAEAILIRSSELKTATKPNDEQVAQSTPESKLDTWTSINLSSQFPSQPEPESQETKGTQEKVRKPIPAQPQPISRSSPLSAQGNTQSVQGVSSEVIQGKVQEGSEHVTQETVQEVPGTSELSPRKEEDEEEREELKKLMEEVLAERPKVDVESKVEDLKSMIEEEKKKIESLKKKGVDTLDEELIISKQEFLLIALKEAILNGDNKKAEELRNEIKRMGGLI